MPVSRPSPRPSEQSERPPHGSNAFSRRKSSRRAIPETTRKAPSWRSGLWVLSLLVVAVAWHGRDDSGLPSAPQPVPRDQPQPLPSALEPAEIAAADSRPIPTREVGDQHGGEGSRVGRDLDPPPRHEQRGVQPVERNATEEQTTQFVLEASDNGSYYVRGTINGESVLFLLDTGATWISIPERLRWTLGLQRGRYVKVATAGGVVGNYETRVESLDVGPFHFQDVAAALNPYAPSDVVLLGMSALKDVQFTQSGGRLILSRQHSDEAKVAAPPLRPEAPALVIRRSVRDCMGAAKILNSDTLKCIEDR